MFTPDGGVFDALLLLLSSPPPHAASSASAAPAIATCAVREARNGPEFCRQVREQVGLDVEVISGDREARLAFSSVQHAFDLTGKNVIVADIGGGSTEIVFATGNLIEAIFSTPLGAVRLTELFGLGEQAVPEAAQRDALRLAAELGWEEEDAAALREAMEAVGVSEREALPEAEALRQAVAEAVAQGVEEGVAPAEADLMEAEEEEE